MGQLARKARMLSRDATWRQGRDRAPRRPDREGRDQVGGQVLGARRCLSSLTQLLGHARVTREQARAALRRAPGAREVESWNAGHHPEYQEDKQHQAHWQRRGLTEFRARRSEHVHSTRPTADVAPDDDIPGRGFRRSTPRARSPRAGNPCRRRLKTSRTGPSAGRSGRIRHPSPEGQGHRRAPAGPGLGLGRPRRVRRRRHGPAPRPAGPPGLPGRWRCYRPVHAEPHGAPFGDCLRQRE